MKKKLVTVKQKITDIGSTLVGMKRKQKEYKKEFEENINRIKAIREKLTSSNTDDKTRMALNGQLSVAQNNVSMLDETYSLKYQPLYMDYIN